MFLKNECENEIKVMKTKFNQEVEVLNKLEPMYSTLRRIKAAALEKGI